MRYDLESMLPEKAFSPRGGRGPFSYGMTLEGGGGKGGGGGTPPPQQATSYQTNVPEYAKPYVTNMLEATQQQLFNMGDSGITGFKPYTPYSTDVNNYFAGFSPMQQQAQQATAQLQVPGQFGAASNLAGTAGMQALGAGNQASALGSEALGYGAAGQMYGDIGAQQALQRAQQTARQAGMYGGMGAGFGAQAAGMAPTAQRFGQEAADIGMGGLGYGALGTGYGAQAAQMSGMGFGAGEQFARQATDPGATQAYMSPYMQNVVDYQKSQALRDFQIGQGMRGAQAVGKGAFGGSRQAIVEAEAERALGSQLQGIAAQGSQKAFEDAQRQQQFGAQLGLQGLGAGYQGLGMGMQGAQTGLQGLGTALQGQQARMQGLGQAGQFLGQGMQGAGVGLQGVGAQQAAGQLGLQGTAQGMQGAGVGLQGVQGAVGAGQYGLQGLGQATQAASTLGQLGGQQLGAQRDIIGLQNQMGGQQQALEQAKINQAIQDYATAQQYPLMQLGMMSNMLRGLPMQATTTQTYQAAPAPITQGLGLLAGAAGAKQAGLFAEGGTIKGLASGGVTNYANRGMVQSNPDSSVVRGIRSKLEMMPADQLQKVAQTSPSEEIRAMALQILQEQKIREQAETQAQQSIAQDQQRGLPAAPAGSMDMLSAASGGIVAFAGPDGSQVDLDEEEANRLQQEFLARQKYTDFYKKQREAAGVGAPKAALGEFYTKEQAALGDAESKNKGYNLMDIGFNLATQTGPLLQAAGKTGRATLPNIIAREEGLRGRRGDVAKGLAEVKEGERLMALGDIEGGNKMFSQAEDRLSKEKIAGTKAPGNMTAYANNYLAERVTAGDKRDQATIRREGMDQYMYLYGQAGPRAATAAVTAETNLFDKARDNVDSSLSKNFNSPENRELRKLQKADKQNNTNTANTYLQELYRKEERRMKGGVPSGGGGGGGGKKAVLPPGFEPDKT